MLVMTMNGLLEPIILLDDLQSVATQLNMAAQQGKQFVVANTRDNEPALISLHNILHAVQREDDEIG